MANASSTQVDMNLPTPITSSFCGDRSRPPARPDTQPEPQRESSEQRCPGVLEVPDQTTNQAQLHQLPAVAQSLLDRTAATNKARKSGAYYRERARPFNDNTTRIGDYFTSGGAARRPAARGCHRQIVSLPLPLPSWLICTSSAEPVTELAFQTPGVRVFERSRAFSPVGARPLADYDQASVWRTDSCLLDHVGSHAFLVQGDRGQAAPGRGPSRCPRRTSRLRTPGRQIQQPQQIGHRHPDLPTASATCCWVSSNSSRRRSSA